MANNNSNSEIISVFQGRRAPEPGYLAGYAALYAAYELATPLPDRLALISKRHTQYETEDWIVQTPRHRPEDTLTGHLTFALRYEGVDLGLLKKLFERVGPLEVQTLVMAEPTGAYSRRIWFLYEWLMEHRLNILDAAAGNYVDVLDSSLQFPGRPVNSKRHRVRNNLPGVKNFCPLIRRTPALEKFIGLDLAGRIKDLFGRIHPDVMARTSAFLLLKDSKASYAIEGERPPQNRAQRWGRAIGEAGEKELDQDELVRLQQIVIDNPRFTKMGYRLQEGFIGEHDRRYGTPLPDHLSARHKDLTSLMEGLIDTDILLEADQDFDAVLAASMIAFGFVFIHPFVDGNGRIHRYLIHNVLLWKHYVSRGIIFPVSAIILERLGEYRAVLEHFSKPRLDLIEWRPTPDNNVEILNNTIDLYSYFDATRQAEFLYSCVQETIEKTIPEEIDYLEKYDRMKNFLDNYIDMPDRTVDMLVRFLAQNRGRLSKRARENEFQLLSEEEITAIEEKYKEVFGDSEPVP